MVPLGAHRTEEDCYDEPHHPPHEPDLAPGSFLFTSSAELAGLVIANGGREPNRESAPAPVVLPSWTELPPGRPGTP